MKNFSLCRVASRPYSALRRTQFLRLARAGIVLLALTVAAEVALAHAIVLEESPAPNSVVKGPNVPLKLRFNVRIDAARSRLFLLMPDGATRELKVKPQSAPDVLAADADGLALGTYKLHWLVLAADGHITQGDILFSVTNP
ncbi:MAG TPA: copper resistance CopC family protein [Candidatus Angelobacter sp.]|nr:copper resistance CopC family protein [Candidatus Angelobacter sp.]